MYRILKKQLEQEKLKKVLVLLGARQVGKTTILKNTFPKAVYVNLEEKNYIDVFNSRDVLEIKKHMQLIDLYNSNIWILDEVQRLDDPGLVAKIIYDSIDDINLIISGSSSLEISNKASESLAGRKKTFTLYPLCFYEYLFQTKKIKTKNKGKIIFEIDKENDKKFSLEIKQSMQYGLYPEMLNLENNKEKEEHLLELVDSIILKDVYYLDLVKNTKNLLSLLKLIAYQIGGQVNYSDLANRVGISRKTVVDYIEILKKTFVIFTLPPYTKNRRDEIGKTEKIYFYDLGIRNALIEDFSPVEYRKDYGGIFENFVISEIKKINSYYRERFGFYYWRTKWGSEVDLILYKDEVYYAIEIKTRKGSITKAFKETYPKTKELVLTMDNIVSFLIN